ncbi:hypothetical protein GGI23_004717, partial [Coemansia sp. RSA 2559]
VLDNWPKVLQAIDKFRIHFKQTRSPLVFAHNDLLAGNFLRLERTGKIEIVDFEYAGYNYRGFDIANHFCEWMVDYTQVEQSDILDPTRYPTEKERHNFLRAYIRAKAFIDANVKANAGAGKSDSAHPMKIRPIELSEEQLCKEVAELDREVALFVTATHLFWGINGLVKASTIDNNFDYVGHAAHRLSYFLSQVADME